MKKRTLMLIFFFIIANCSKIQVITPQANDFYRKPFLEDIKLVKKIYKDGNKKEALQRLGQMKLEELLPSEKALGRNLMGVIHFSQSEFPQAITLFKEALTFDTPDKSLISQIHLNLASTYYRVGDFENSQVDYSLVDVNMLSPEEAKKYYHLQYIFGKKENDPKKILKALIQYLGLSTSLSQLRDDPLYPELENAFFQLDSGERMSFIKNIDSERPLLSVPYLAYLEAQRQYSQGQKDSAFTVIHWIKENAAFSEEINRLADDFLTRLENYSKINSMSIGLVLPFSGKRKKYADDTMLGIDHAFQKFFKQKNSENGPIIHVRDSMGNGVVGAFAVKELIEKHFVSVVIGGLFSDEATKEYLEAKKRGTLFISLSQIYLPKEEKDHLLIEIPGSVESQVRKAFSPEILGKFGKKVALLVPEDERGEAYLEETWRQASGSGVEIVEIQKYLKDSNDYRETVKQMLGMNFKRERKEELELLGQIHALQGPAANQKGQVLTPVIDFDWVFLPAFPDEALKLIPTFKYFDAPKISFIGGPSWRSKTLGRIGGDSPLYFIGNDINESVAEFRKSFFNQNKKWPGLIEIISFDAMKIASNLVNEDKFNTRIDFENYVKKKGTIEGLEGNWKTEEGVWVKEMSPFKFYKNRIGPLEEGTENELKRSQPEEEENVL